MVFNDAAKGRFMSSEPSYPKDGAVGSGTDEPLNETLRHAAAAKEASKASRERSARRGWVTGAAVGVGSAAVVAALLYARSSRRSDRGGNDES